MVSSTSWNELLLQYKQNILIVRVWLIYCKVIVEIVVASRRVIQVIYHLDHLGMNCCEQTIDPGDLSP